MIDFYTEKNFMSNEHCKHLIKLYNNNLKNTYSYDFNKTKPLNLFKFLFNDDVIMEVINKIEKKYFDLYGANNIDLMELVRWPVSSKMPTHKDKPGDKFAFIIYLNDDYTGGETIINESIIVKPEVGMLLTFAGYKFNHGVNEVKNNERYTLVGWCK